MEKMKFTRSDVHRMYNKVFQADYCALYPLYESREAIGYNHGVYGWNWHLYAIGGGIAITSGYRSMTGAELPERARKILRNAEKHLKTYKPYSDYDKKQAYIKRARRAFEKALQDA